MLTVNVEGTQVAVVPADPTRKAIVAMLDRGTNDIWNLGKDAQRRLRVDVVPPNYEAEKAAGRYLRAVEAAPPALAAAIVDLRAALEARATVTGVLVICYLMGRVGGVVFGR